MTATLRQAVRSDVEGIQRVRHAVKENRLTSRVITDEEVVHAIERSGRGWVVEVQSQVVAFSIGNSENGNIWALFVDPEYEGQGYGRRLHDEMLRWLWSCGLERLWLSTQKGTRAERFYQLAGWRHRGLLPSGEVLFELGASAQRAHEIRRCGEADWPAVWTLLQTTFEAGDTYAFSPLSTEAEIHRAWIEAPSATYIACGPGGEILGTYFIKPNQPGLGSHVCNCGYVVAPEAQGQGIATALCEHSQAVALAMGFLAMQFNLVVSTNERAIRLWRRLGFSVIGTLPRAFRHRKLGLVDALIMYKALAKVE